MLKKIVVELMTKHYSWQKSTSRFTKVFLPGLLLLASCGNSTTAENTVAVTVADTVPDTVADDSSDNLFCDPGSCEAQDQNYLSFVRGNLPPSFIGQLSDSQLFEMANTWCKAVNDGEWAKIDSLFQKETSVGNTYKLYYYTFFASTAFCYFDQEEMLDYLKTIPMPS